MADPFQVLSWVGEDVDDQGYTVFLFGRTEDGRSVSVRCPFSPYFFVRLPEWYTDAHVRQIPRCLPGCVSAKRVQRKTFYGFTNQTPFWFARLLFSTKRDMSRTVSKLRSGRVDLGTGARTWELFETQLDPILRFMHVTGVQASGWVTLERPRPVAPHETTCALEYEVDSWLRVHPDEREAVSPCVFASYDIETYSGDGSFPDPMRDDCPIIQIATTWWRYGDADPFSKQLLTLKACDPIDGVEVESFATERDLLVRWANWIRERDPDFTVSYNGWGFDDHYVFTRMKATQATAGLFFSRFRSEAVRLYDKRLNSAAYGDNTFRMFQASGRTSLDLLQIMKRDHKLASYSLNNVSQHFLKDKKVDMPYQEMFDRYARGGSSDIAAIGTYCVYDTVLPVRLLQKLNVVPQLVEMSKACWVPIAFLLVRGQQIKVFSQLAYFTRKENMLMPTLDARRSDRDGPDDAAGSDGEKGFQGASVLAARSGAYMDDIVTCLDFASLYPSIMRAHNLCHSTLVMEAKYDGLEGVEYETLEVQGSVYKFVQNVPGVLPRLLEQLAKRRKLAKKEMAAAIERGDSFAEQVFNGKQLAFKVSMNSIYGFCGAINGFLPCMAVASSVTSIGRSMIDQSKTYAETHYPGAQVVYGDSVGKDTPVYVRVDGTPQFVTVETLGTRYGTGPWRSMERGCGKEARELVDGVDSWTESGWTPIRRLIRHDVGTKRMVRVTTYRGSVDVTEDHSLLTTYGEPVRPRDVSVGDLLLHAKCPVETNANGPFDLDLARVFERGRARDWSAIHEDGVWTGSPLRKRTYVDGVFASADEITHTVCVPDGIVAAQLFAMIRTIGAHVELVPNPDSRGYLLRMGWRTCPPDRAPRSVIDVSDIEYEGYVYDLTTDTHHFHAGVGELVVHNTDSIFVKFPSDPTLSKRERMEEAFRLGETSAETITSIFRPPIELEFEKCYSPLLLFTKKRYCGLMFAAETGPERAKKIDVKGISIVRRDTTPFVASVLQTMIEKIMYEKDVQGAIDHVERETQRLLDQRVPIDQLVLSKTLRTGYKNENLAHLGVVDKMRRRNPGSEPKSGARVPFVYVEHDNPDALQFDRAEDPDYAKEQGLCIDAAYYLERTLVQPVSDLLVLFVDNPSKEIFGPYLKRLQEQRQRKLGDWKRKRDGLADIRTFFARPAP